MAEIRVPFCASAELSASFILDETYSEPNGLKSVLFDSSGLKVMGRLEIVDMPDFGPVQMLLYYVVGAIPYICNAFPVVKSGADVQQAMSIFNDREGNSAREPAASMASDVLGWISVSGSVYVEAPIGGAGTFGVMPSVQSVTVEDLAVANAATFALAPANEETQSKDKEVKKVVTWNGGFVITTA